MMMNPIEKLIIHYFSGSLSEAEYAQLKQVVLSSNQEEVESVLHKLWLQYDHKEELPSSSFDELTRKLGLQTTPIVKKNKIRMFNYFAMAKVASVAILLIIGSYFVMKNIELTDFMSRQMIVSVNSGERARITLPDGSTVQLNAATSLAYFSNFGYKKRNVRLSGEAYFEVAKDSISPFTVETPYLDIEALGTVFNVYAYESESIIETSLLNGSVRITTKDQTPQTVILKPNEKVVYNKQTKQLKCSKTDNRFETAWTRGELTFRSVPFEELLSHLERYYGIKFSVEGDCSGFKKYTGTFNAGEVTDVLELLKFHYPISYTFRNNQACLKISDPLPK